MDSEQPLIGCVIWISPLITTEILIGRLTTLIFYTVIKYATRYNLVDQGLHIASVRTR